MADIVPGLALPEIDAYSTLQTVNFVFTAIVILAIVAVFLVIGFKKKWFFKFPTVFDIMKVENGNLSTVDTDFGRRVLKKNRDGSIKELYYDIKKRNFKWYPPSFESTVATKKGRSKIYVRELYPNKWEIIDPKSFVTGKPEDYRRTEGDELDSYFKNTQDDMAELKYKMDSSGWDKLLGMLSPILPIAVAGIIFILIATQVLLPAMDRANTVVAAIDASSQNMNMSTTLLDKSVQFLDYVIQIAKANNLKIPENLTGVIP
jgi:hypothetical protein